MNSVDFFSTVDLKSALWEKSYVTSLVRNYAGFRVGWPRRGLVQIWGRYLRLSPWISAVGLSTDFSDGKIHLVTKVVR